MQPPQPTTKREILFILLGALLFSFIMLNNHILPLDGPESLKGDYAMMTWNLWHVAESILNLENPFITNKIYYPIGANLTTHSLASGFFPISILVKYITTGSPLYPLITFKIIVWISFPLILLFTYLTLRELGFCFIEALIPALAFSFSNFFISHIQHLNLISGFFIPLVAFLTIRLYKFSTLSRWIVLAIFLAWSVYFTEFTLFIYLSIILLVALTLLLPNSRQEIITKTHQTKLSHFVLFSILFVVLFMPFAWYFATSKAIPPNPKHPFLYSANAAGFFIPSPVFTPLYNIPLFQFLSEKNTLGMTGSETFLGFPFLILTILGIFHYRNGKYFWHIAIMASIFFTLSLGPRLIFFQNDTNISLPYRALMTLPIFNQLRTPVRLMIFGMFFFTIFSAYGIQYIVKLKTSTTFKFFILSNLLMWSIAETYWPKEKENSYIIPKKIINQIKHGPVAISPLINADNDYKNMAYQIFHDQPISIGYLARLSQAHIQQRSSIWALNLSNPFSDNFTQISHTYYATLNSLGVKNLILTDNIPFKLFHELQKYPMNLIVTSSSEYNLIVKREFPVQNGQKWTMHLDDLIKSNQIDLLITEGVFDVYFYNNQSPTAHLVADNPHPANPVWAVFDLTNSLNPKLFNRIIITRQKNDRTGGLQAIILSK